MTIKKLISKLQKLPTEYQDAKVVLSSDAEGNDFELLNNFSFDPEPLELGSGRLLKKAVIFWPK